MASFQLEGYVWLAIDPTRWSLIVVHWQISFYCTLAVIVSIMLCAHEAQGGLQCDAALAVHIITPRACARGKVIGHLL